VIALLLLLVDALAGCPVDPTDALLKADQATWDAYYSLDEVAFDLAANAHGQTIGCVRRKLSDTQAAQLHRTQALIAFVNGQNQASRRGWLAARSLDAQWALSRDDFPESHPLWKMFLDTVPSDPESTTGLPELATASWVVDGYADDVLPEDRPFIAQIMLDGSALYTGYHVSSDSLPRFPELEPLRAQHVEVRIGALGVGSVVRSTQASPDAESPWEAQDGGGPSGGFGLLARWTPHPNLGTDLRYSGLGGSDPIRGGGFGHELTWVGLFGYETLLSDVSLRAAARGGLAVDGMRAWGYGTDEAEVYTIGSMNLGFETTVGADPILATVTADYLLASGYVPYQVRLGLLGGARINRFVGLETGVAWHRRSLAFTDTTGADIGERADSDLRAHLGLAWWR